MNFKYFRKIGKSRFLRGGARFHLFRRARTFNAPQRKKDTLLARELRMSGGTGIIRQFAAVALAAFSGYPELMELSGFMRRTTALTRPVDRFVAFDERERLESERFGSIKGCGK